MIAPPLSTPRNSVTNTKRDKIPNATKQVWPWSYPPIFCSFAIKLQSNYHNQITTINHTQITTTNHSNYQNSTQLTHNQNFHNPHSQLNHNRITKINNSRNSAKINLQKIQPSKNSNFKFQPVKLK